MILIGLWENIFPQQSAPKLKPCILRNQPFIKTNWFKFDAMFMMPDYIRTSVGGIVIFYQTQTLEAKPSSIPSALRTALAKPAASSPW